MIKRSLLRHWEVNLAGIPRAELERTQGPLRVLLRNIAKKTGAEWIDPTSHLCSESSCPTISKQGTGVYMDETHLSSNYVRDYVTFLDQFILFGQK